MIKYIFVLFVMFSVMAVSLTALQYDDANPNGFLVNFAHYFRYILSGLRK
jgi:hypothetical protein